MQTHTYKKSKNGGDVLTFKRSATKRYTNWQLFFYLSCFSIRFGTEFALIFSE